MGDTEYGTNTQRLNGVQQGIASSQLNNKFSYQTSLVAYALAQIMMQNGFNANDSDAVTTFVSNMSSTLLQKVTDKANKTMAEAGTDDSHFMTPLQVKYAIDSIFTSGFTVGGSGIILPGNPTNPLGAVPKQYVDDSIGGIKFPATVTELYNQNKDIDIAFPSNNVYDVTLITLNDSSYFENNFLIIQYKINSCSLKMLSSTGGNDYFYVKLLGENIAYINTAGSSAGQTITLQTNGTTSYFILYHLYSALTKDRINYPSFALITRDSVSVGYNGSIDLRLQRDYNLIQRGAINIDIKILLAKFT